MWIAPLLVLGLNPPLPVITVDRDNVVITQSCTIYIAADSIPDSDGNGVIQITSDGVTVDFNNQRLHGGASTQPPDTFGGIGVNITGKNVILKNAKVSGYKIGIHAINADGLTIHHGDVSNNYHQRLKSTTTAEDTSDWLWPHNNDNNEWMTNYGAGICIEDSSNVTLHNIRARKTQNGIILDRVNDSKVYDCDCSFLSGWGLAMWRSNRNVISRNAFDFCIRGYSHGVYNRGQDSAGILVFEQCSDNVIAENSATHGGDGFFGFAGKEALGEVNPREEMHWYIGRGNSNNIIIGNDLSYAAAHGLELTFSTNNQIWKNRFEGNAICGIWGGYSRALDINENAFTRNGDSGYGSERGGINIEHGVGNWIRSNAFADNACGIHLWWDDDAGLLALPWAKANDVSCKGNWISDNSFSRDAVAIHLGTCSETRGFRNQFNDAARHVQADAESLQELKLNVSTNMKPEELRPFEILGDYKPVGARAALSGREKIIMTEWGPWDHASPLLRFVRRFDRADEYRLLGAAEVLTAEQVHHSGNVTVDVQDDRILVRPQAQDMLIPYEISCTIDGHTLRVTGMLSCGSWEVWTFPSACDPREDVDRWRREGTSEHHTLTADALDFRFGSGGMTEARALPVPVPRDHFGVIATRSLNIPSGHWRIRTTSDDGIRVWMNGHLIIDDWTWHAPKEHIHEFTVDEARPVSIRVEYFELNGHAALSLDFERVK